jgi:hypothetical protein
LIIAVIVGEGMISKMVRAQCGYYAMSRSFRHRYISESIARSLAKRIVAVALVISGNLNVNSVVAIRKERERAEGAFCAS